ncbi:MAG: metallophosphatase family protein [Proteobacteria bacterium]|nr:metallophosphatase family protein [Pseudomonadota bacterium]
MKLVGILSDTHMSSITDSFVRQCATAFNRCDAIIHAGDLTDVSILSAFSGKDIHAVSGNMCSWSTRQVLPEDKLIIIAGFSIGITHGAGPRHNIEDRMLIRFPTADCIIYGHTHLPACRRIGNTLLVNPGSFQGTGKHGFTGTYAILHLLDTGIQSSIHTLSPLP